MFRLLIRTIVWLVRALFRSRSDLALENLALRQQLAISKDKRSAPRLDNPARAFWVGLRSAWPSWMDALILVRPETVAQWHRKGFRLYWRRKSQSHKPGRPRVSREVRDLIRKMAIENSWRAPRIHGELKKLGFDVSERTVSRYLPRHTVNPNAVKRWMTDGSVHGELPQRRCFRPSAGAILTRRGSKRARETTRSFWASITVSMSL